MEAFSEIKGFNEVSSKDSKYNRTIQVTNTDNYNKRELDRLLAMYSVRDVTLNGESIEDDIKKLADISEQNKRNRRVRESCSSIEKYLEKLKEVSGRHLQFKLMDSEVGIVSFPYNLHRFREFGIIGTDYVNVEDNILVSVNYDNLLDAIAMDICRFDFGIDNEFTEDKLRQYGMVRLYDDSILQSLYTEAMGREVASGKFYDMCLSMMVGDTDFLIREDKKILDYFNSEFEYKRRSTMYREVLESSAHKLMKILVCELLRIIDSQGFGYKVLAVNDGLITFILDRSVDIDSIEDMISLGVILKILGRRVIFNPEIQIRGVEERS